MVDSAKYETSFRVFIREAIIRQLCRIFNIVHIIGHLMRAFAGGNQYKIYCVDSRDIENIVNMDIRNLHMLANYWCIDLSLKLYSQHGRRERSKELPKNKVRSGYHPQLSCAS